MGERGLLKCSKAQTVLYLSCNCTCTCSVTVPVPVTVLYLSCDYSTDSSSPGVPWYPVLAALRKAFEAPHGDHAESTDSGDPRGSADRV